MPSIYSMISMFKEMRPDVHYFPHTILIEDKTYGTRRYTVPCLLFCFQMVLRINCPLSKSLKTTQNHPEIEFLQDNWKCYLHQCCFSWRPSWRFEFSVIFKGGLPSQNSSSDFVVCKNFNPRYWDWENHDFRWQVHCEPLLRCSWRDITCCLKWQYYATVVIQIRAAS